MGMRVLGSTMLCLQAVVLLLALPVAITVNGAPTALAASLFIATVLLCFIAIGVVTRPVGRVLGWLVQFATVGLGFLVPWLFVLAVVFLSLWWAALHFAGKVEQLNAARAGDASTE
ncbi:MAG: DUF4233 domain-containing protein [Actinobacteria bacterium]|nr:DUF4233 domain-containing protein [Actinomycetota bacterium]